jgi:hypothetical protein
MAANNCCQVFWDKIRVQVLTACRFTCGGLLLAKGGQDVVVGRRVSHVVPFIHLNRFRDGGRVPRQIARVQRERFIRLCLSRGYGNSDIMALRASAGQLNGD